jgi:hypothetical protein
MTPQYEFRECLLCEFIEDCPHPTVDESGSPIPPVFCAKKDKIKLVSRISELTPPENV